MDSISMKKAKKAELWKIIKSDDRFGSPKLLKEFCDTLKDVQKGGNDDYNSEDDVDDDDEEIHRSKISPVS